jgi:hypothetical protein
VIEYWSLTSVVKKKRLLSLIVFHVEQRDHCVMLDYWQEFLELLSDEELIRFERRAQMAGKPELAAQFEAKLAEFRQTELIHDIQS